jgi:phosphate transport system protein
MDHTYSRFDTDLIALRSEVLTMAALVERQFLRAVDAIRGGDPALVARVLADESEVNRRHLQTDSHCSTMIVRLQPLAVDLREIVAVLHINNDLERIGDEARKIAIRARNLNARSLPQGLLDRLHDLAVSVAEMLRDSASAYARRDSALAAAVVARDPSVDSARDRLIAALVEGIGRNHGPATVGVDLAFVTQSIERVGDHAKNIAEYVIRIVDGVDPRHRAVA